MWGIAVRTLDSYEDAADVVQEALIRAHQNAARCRMEGSVKNWLMRIVVNACYDRYRRNRARPCDPMPDETIERLPAPRDPIAERQLTLDVQDALVLLPIQQRVVVLLVDMHGYPTREVADMLGIPVGTVKSRCSRARERLAQVLRDSRSEGKHE